MEHESPEQSKLTVSPRSAENEISAEPTTPKIDALPRRLGFVETPEMALRRAQWIEAIHDQEEDASEIDADYQRLFAKQEAAQIAGYRAARQRVADWMTGQAPTSADEGYVLAEVGMHGYVETNEMLAARSRLDIDPDYQHLNDYQRLGDKQEAEYEAKLRIGQLVTQATVWRDAGKPEFYREDLENALQYAYARGLNDIIKIIENALQ